MSINVCSFHGKYIIGNGILKLYRNGSRKASLYLLLKLLFLCRIFKDRIINCYQFHVIVMRINTLLIDVQFYGTSSSR